MSEVTAVERKIFDLLADDPVIVSLAGGRVYTGVVPPEGVYPCILATPYTADGDEEAEGRIRVNTGLTYIVRAIQEGNDLIGTIAVGETKGILERLAERIDLFLHAQAYNSVGGTIEDCGRISPYEQRAIDPKTGKFYSSLGGIYEFVVGEE